MGTVFDSFDLKKYTKQEAKRKERKLASGVSRGRTPMKVDQRGSRRASSKTNVNPKSSTASTAPLIPGPTRAHKSVSPSLHQRRTSLDAAEKGLVRPSASAATRNSPSESLASSSTSGDLRIYRQFETKLSMSDNSYSLQKSQTTTGIILEKDCMKRERGDDLGASQNNHLLNASARPNVKCIMVVAYEETH